MKCLIIVAFIVAAVSSTALVHPIQPSVYYPTPLALTGGAHYAHGYGTHYVYPSASHYVVPTKQTIKYVLPQVVPHVIPQASLVYNPYQYYPYYSGSVQAYKPLTIAKPVFAFAEKPTAQAAAQPAAKPAAESAQPAAQPQQVEKPEE